MAIYVGGSSRYLAEDIESYRTIMNTVHAAGHGLSYDWINTAYTHRDTIKNNERDWHTILQDNIEGITRSDLVIIEGTRYGFAEGLFISMALEQKKPVLCVMKSVDLADRIASGIDDKLFVLKCYADQSELQKSVDEFIQENTLTSKDLRFNFFIDNEIYNHLRWASFKTGKTKAEIIRDLINKEIEKSDY